LAAFRTWEESGQVLRMTKFGLLPTKTQDYGPAMTISTPAIIAALTQILTSKGVIADPAQMGNFLNEPRKRFHQTALAVVLPETVEEVQAIARFANEHGLPLIPQGGNTGLVGGQVPLSGNEIIVSLIRLDKVRSIDANAGNMTVEAGLTLEAAHKAAEGAGAMLPLWIASQGSARIGGVLSSNAGGVQVLAYGNARELCLGVEAVLADGRLYQGLNALKKDNTGYDLKDLLVGAEGTLGIITAATLKLFPQPEEYETALVNVASPEAALTLFSAMRERAGATLTAFEIVPHIGLDIQLRHKMLDKDPTAGPSPWYVLIEISRPKGGQPGALQLAVEAAYEAGTISNAVLAESLADRTRMWAFREQMSECQSREGASIKHDVSVPIAAVPQLIAEGSAAVSAIVPGIRPVPFGHMGDGNIHFNLSQPTGADGRAFMAGAEPVHAVIYEVVTRLGGSISAEHGIGQLKTDLLIQHKDPVAIEMMRAIKQALDPKGILNPGKVLG
jgi:FAD/FMN-containing dehydrogenase